MKDTRIQWCDHTYNPWRGCAKVSPGCANCYAEQQARRNPAVLGEWGPGRPRVKARSDKDIRRLNRLKFRCEHCERWWPDDWCYACGVDISDHVRRRQRIFCGSMMDVWDEDVHDHWRHELFELIVSCPNLDFLLLTKRPELISECWPCDWMNKPMDNVWLGVSAEDQQRWDERVPRLLAIPARVRFVSVEPMLGRIDMEVQPPDCNGVSDADWTGHEAKQIDPRIHWVIFGGESGPKSRPCNVGWIRDGVRQCREAGVAAFVKQLGAFAIYEEGSQRKRWLLDDRKGGDPAEWTEDLRVREWPGGAK